MNLTLRPEQRVLSFAYHFRGWVPTAAAKQYYNQRKQLATSPY